MGNLTFVQDEREIVHVYKRISAERVQAEAAAAAELKRAEAEAATKQKQAETAAEFERNVAHKRVEQEIKLAHTYLDEVKGTLQTLSFLPIQLQGSSPGAYLFRVEGNRSAEDSNAAK